MEVCYSNVSGSRFNKLQACQAQLSQFYLLVKFFIGKVPVKSKDSRVLMLVNFTPVLKMSCMLTHAAFR